jgi:hypothetical protein
MGGLLLVEQMSYVGFECFDGDAAGSVDSDRSDQASREQLVEPALGLQEGMRPSLTTCSARWRGNGFREFRAGLLGPRGRNKTLTALAALGVGGRGYPTLAPDDDRRGGE